MKSRKKDPSNFNRPIPESQPTNCKMGIKRANGVQVCNETIEMFPSRTGEVNQVRKIPYVEMTEEQI